jgi:hypothetical protein
LGIRIGFKEAGKLRERRGQGYPKSLILRASSFRFRL